MTIGASLLLIAVGAILRFAVSTVNTHGIGVHTIGDILMIVGVVGLLLWLFIWGPWARSRRRQTPNDVVVERDPDGYVRRRYPDGRYPDGRYPDDYSTSEYPPEVSDPPPGRYRRG